MSLHYLKKYHHHHFDNLSCDEIQQSIVLCQRPAAVRCSTELTLKRIFSATANLGVECSKNNGVRFFDYYLKDCNLHQPAISYIASH